MSAPVLLAPLDPAVLGPASRFILETREQVLSYETDELAALRFSIILTARWEASEDEDPESRAGLRGDLQILRRHYADKLDDIAMTFGVEAAMHAKEDVERNVVVPCDLTPGAPTAQLERICPSEDGAGDFEL
jgi:hypothetical protein